MAFCKVQPWRILKPEREGGGGGGGGALGEQDKDFGAVSQMDLTRSLVPSVAQSQGSKETKLTIAPRSGYLAHNFL